MTIHHNSACKTYTTGTERTKGQSRIFLKHVKFSTEIIFFCKEMFVIQQNPVSTKCGNVGLFCSLSDTQNSLFSNF
jgi:hypothetical protein